MFSDDLKKKGMIMCGKFMTYIVTIMRMRDSNLDFFFFIIKENKQYYYWVATCKNFDIYIYIYILYLFLDDCIKVIIFKRMVYK